MWEKQPKIMLEITISTVSLVLSLKPGFPPTECCAVLPGGVKKVDIDCDEALAANNPMCNAITAPRVPANTSDTEKVLMNISCSKPIAQIPNIALIIDERCVTNNPIAISAILSEKAKLG